jgi:hypothetical protein
MPATEEPTTALGGIIGFILVNGGGTENPATEVPVAKAAAAKKELEIEEIIYPEEEIVAPQCIHVARKRGDEWVVHEEDHSDRGIRKLQKTVDDLMGQIKVRALEALCILIRLL